jgi:O-antigen/teichoic acid export membrane protein
MHRGPSVIALSRIVSVALGLINTWIVARFLGPEGRGSTAAALSALFLAPIFKALGVPMVVRRWTSKDHTSEVVRAARLLAMMAILPSALLAWLIVSVPLAALSPEERTTTFIGVCLAPLTILWICDESVLVAQNRYVEVALIQLVLPATSVSINLVCLMARSFSAVSFLITNIVGSGVTYLASSAMVRVPIRGPRLSIKLTIREAFTYAGSLSAEAASNRLDQLLLLPLMGSVQLGLYSIAATVATVPLGLAYALTARFYRGIAQASSAERRDIQAEAARASLYWALLAAVAVAGGCWAFIPIVFGAGFAGAVFPCVWASLGTVGLVASQVCSNALAADNRGAAMTIAQLGGLVVAVILMLILAPRWGAAGAAVASTTGYLLTFILVLSALHLRPRDLLPSRSRASSALGAMIGR